MSKEHTIITDRSIVDQLPTTPIDSIGAIVQDMRASFASGTMRDINFRKQQLQALLRGLREHEQILLDASAMDMSRSPQESRFFDLGPVEYEIGQFLRYIDKWARPDKHPLASEQTAFLMSSMEVRKEPLGTVVIIGAWNFPARLNLVPLIGALAAGNTVVLKPSDVAVQSAIAIGDLVTEYLDPRVVRVVQGGHYFYTGSGKVGKIVAKAAAEHLAGVTLELGGKSPVVVHSDVSDLEAAAARIMWGKLTNAGQTCVGQSPDYVRIINDRHWQRIMALLNNTTGDILNTCDDGPDQADRYIPPTLVDGVRPEDSLLSDEIFGPVLPIITYDILDEALDYINSHDQPLALYAFGSSKTTEYIISNTRSGGAVANDAYMHMAAHHYPFGGTGPSGVGRYMGKYSFDTFSHHRSVLKNSLRFPPAQSEWKSGGRDLAFPHNFWLRTSFWGKAFTFIPFWRLLASTRVVFLGLVYGRSATRARKHPK
ncbi:aldehyde dehydrogenase [Linderina pennispora]|uniref:Aldehyde dehydrogenase n=1 Tax=Linderina pennispora TaxID=61395 RepID=A0A1Y1WLL1_9FUNG|nr:aldehyde dehydrogenase [Linderina pennispora]ORX74461.1 aldehyde dehydrogenase [Linderina pennispora]